MNMAIKSIKYDNIVICKIMYPMKQEKYSGRKRLRKDVF